MNGNGKMSANSWIIVESLAALVAFGVLAFFYEPKYAFGVGVIVSALISVLNNATGSKSGAKMPEQAGEPKPGQASVTEIHTESAPPNPPAPGSGDAQKPL